MVLPNLGKDEHEVFLRTKNRVPLSQWEFLKLESSKASKTKYTFPHDVKPGLINTGWWRHLLLKCYPTQRLSVSLRPAFRSMIASLGDMLVCNEHMSMRPPSAMWAPALTPPLYHCFAMLPSVVRSKEGGMKSLDEFHLCLVWELLAKDCFFPRVLCMAEINHYDI